MSGLGAITLGAALVSALILGVFLVKNPERSVAWRILLFLGIAVLPTIAAGTSTTDALQRTTTREFCGSCHVMQLHLDDAIDPNSLSLASRHTRNAAFGEHSCYKCHENYGMYGYPLTKLNGLQHVRHYYLGEYRSMSLKEALPKLHLYKPFPNSTCMQCHAGTGPFWKNVPDHKALEEDVKANRVSCASAGCHGAVHPFTRAARKEAGITSTNLGPGSSEREKKPKPEGKGKN